MNSEGRPAAAPDQHTTTLLRGPVESSDLWRPAEIVTQSRPRLTFVASSCRIDGPWVHAHGVWRSWTGPESDRRPLDSDPRVLTWGVDEVREIRWVAGVET